MATDDPTLVQEPPPRLSDKEEDEDLERRTLLAMRNIHHMLREAKSRESQKSAKKAAIKDRPPPPPDEENSGLSPGENSGESDGDIGSLYDDCGDESQGDDEITESGSEDEDGASDSSAGLSRAGYTLSKYRINSKVQLELDDKSTLLDRFNELNKFMKANGRKLSKRQILNCVIQLEDYLYEAKKKSGAAISQREMRDAEDTSDEENGTAAATKNGLRTAQRVPKVKKNLTKEESLRYNADGALLGPDYYSKLPVEPHHDYLKTGIQKDETRNFKIAEQEWSKEDLYKEAERRLPFIDPEVKITLELIKQKSIKEQEESHKYLKDIYYHPDDLKLITIDTLPCNGPEKPVHPGPQSAAYYYCYTRNLFASIKTWIKKYALPPRNQSINLNDPEIPESVRSTARALQYYIDAEDFSEDIAIHTVVPKRMIEGRAAKRLAFFMFIFHQILDQTIFSHWLYGFDQKTADKVLEWGDLEREAQNTAEGHKIRGLWFVEQVRRRETNMNQKIIRHQMILVSRLRQIFVPLFKNKFPDSKTGHRRMAPSAERELQMIVSDAQALQLMFQSEYIYHKIQLDQPNWGFERGWMVDATDKTVMKDIGEDYVMPPLGSGPKDAGLGFAYEPTLFIDDMVKIWEKAVY